MKVISIHRRLVAALFAFAAALHLPVSMAAQRPVEIDKVDWIHGAVDCKAGVDPAIQVVKQDATTYVLRQSKCLSYEAPFIYLLIGSERALLLDTGATAEADAFPLYDTVRSLVGELPLLILHSHSHSDHYRGDVQFSGKPGVELVAPSASGLEQFFSGDQGSGKGQRLNLGSRELIILETPGHQEEAITVYDSQTDWLLTGDTVYPGLVYVKDWAAYRESIGLLARFVASNEVSSLLGAHIEMMDKAGEYYPIGTVYQPQEAPLPLNPEVLQRLDKALASSEGDEAIQMDELVIQPMNGLQRAVSNLARFLTQ